MKWQKIIRKNKLLKILIQLGLFLLVFVIFFQKIDFSSIDLGRHIENGRQVFENKDVLFTNFYSYTEQEMSFINHHWLAGLIFYAVFSLGGFQLLSLFFILLAEITFFVYYKLAIKRANFYFAALLSVPVIFLLSERVEIRPEMFSYLFLGLTWLIFESTKLSPKKKTVLLMGLFAIWANTHIYFFVGLIFLACKLLHIFIGRLDFQADKIRENLVGALASIKTEIRNFFLIVAACLLSPNHIKGLLYPLNIFKNYGYQVAENKSIFFLDDLMLNYNFDIFKMLIVLLAISFLAYWIFKREHNWFNISFGLFVTIFALFASRNIAIFSLIALVLIASGTNNAVSILGNKLANFYQDRGRIKIVIFSSLVVILSGSILYLMIDSSNNHNYLKGELGFGLRAGSEDSFNFFRESDIKGPIFNNYDSGSALIYGLSGQEKVFVDNRPEAYSVKFFQEVYLPMQNDSQKWTEVSEAYKFKTIFFSHTDSTPWGRNFLTRILHDDNWQLIYFDDYYVILSNRRDPENKQVLEKFSINEWRFRELFRELVKNSDLKSKYSLADLAQSYGSPDLAEEVYRQILISKPSNDRAILSLAYLYSNSTERSSWSKSIEYFNRSLLNEERTPGVYNRLALVYWQLLDYKNAELYWKKALRINRQDANAKYYLDQVKELKRTGQLPD